VEISVKNVTVDMQNIAGFPSCQAPGPLLIVGSPLFIYQKPTLQSVREDMSAFFDDTQKIKAFHNSL